MFRRSHNLAVLTAYAAVAVMSHAGPTVAQPQGQPDEPDCRVPRAFATVRPDDTGPPTRVRVGLLVVDVTKIDETARTTSWFGQADIRLPDFFENAVNEIRC